MATVGYASPPLSRVDFRPGSTVGRFRIGEQLGKGATGDVYRAEDTKLKRVVALKRLAPAFRTDQSYRQRFQKEAEEVSRFCDAHVAALHDVLEEQDEMLLVMEYVEGQTLRKRMQSPLSVQESLGIAIQCAEGFASAHDLGIIHCDIKPENIMLTAHGQVKILDFGLAKHLPRSDQSTTLEKPTELAGTPAYMSPEVLSQRVPDSRSDVFSLGVMFYEILTRHHPFAADNFLAIADRIRQETPASIRIFNPEVSRKLEAIVFKAMAKDPIQRYANAREMLEDLRLLESGTVQGVIPITAKVWPGLPFSWRWLVAAGITLLIAAAGYIAFIRSRVPSPILKERGWVLVTDFDTGGDDSIPAAAVREGLTIALQQSRYVNVVTKSRIYDVLERMKKSDASRIDENLGREVCRRENVQVLMTGSIEPVGSVFQITVRALDPVKGRLLFAEQERFDRREQLLASADRIARRIRSDLGESAAGIENSSRALAKVSTASIEALQLYSQASDAMARGDLNRVPALLQGALAIDPDFAMAHALLGTYYSWLVGKNQRAVAEYARAYQLRGQVTDRERRRIEAYYYASQERYDEAVQSLSVLVGLYPDDADAHDELASAYDSVGQLDGSIAELRQVIRLNPHSILGYRHLILYLARKGAYPEALEAFEQARQRGVKSAELHWGLGLAYLGQGNVAQAREEFIRLGQGQEADQDLKELYLVITDLYEGKLDSAAATLRRQIALTPSSTEELRLFRRYLLGRILLEQNRKREAMAQADLMLQYPDSALQTSDLVQAGIIYARGGSIEKARTMLRRVDQSRKSSPSSWVQCSFHNLEGEIYLAENKLTDAGISFSMALSKMPQVDSHVGLARVYQAQSNLTFAAEEWNKVILGQGEILQNDFPPELALAHLELARIYEQLHHRDLAIRHCHEFLRMWQQADESPILREAKDQLSTMTKG